MDFWKTCRVLNNRTRLALLRDIVLSPCHAMNVMQSADRARQKKSVTSQYLKQLSVAGFLSVERTGRYAICGSNRISRSPLARLQMAIAELFAADPEGRRDDEVLSKINALSHHGRIEIARRVAEREGGIRFEELAESTGFHPATLYRQLGVLISAGIIASGVNAGGMRTYSMAPQSDAFFAVLVSLALDYRLGDNSQSL